jgi:D-alanyl-D-alanine carboxypeptidase
MKNPWPHDDSASLIAFYGEPGKVKLGNVIVPWDMFYTEDIHHVIHSFAMHVKCLPAMNRIMGNVWEHYGKSQKQIEAVGMHLWGGAYNARTIRGSTRWSVHAFGAAVDFDPAHNAMNVLGNDPHKMAQAVIDAFKAEGAYWGGDFVHRHDPMHFQFAHE